MCSGVTSPTTSPTLVTDRLSSNPSWGSVTPDSFSNKRKGYLNFLALDYKHHQLECTAMLVQFHRTQVCVKQVCLGQVKRNLVIKASEGSFCSSFYTLRWSCSVCSEDSFTAGFRHRPFRLGARQHFFSIKLYEISGILVNCPIVH